MTTGTKKRFLKDLGSSTTLSTLPVWICAIGIGLNVIYVGRTLLLPIVTALFAYLALRPVITRGRSLKIPSAVSAAALMIGLVILVAFGIYSIYRPAQEVIAEAPSNLVLVKQKLGFVFEKIDDFNEATSDLTEAGAEAKTVKDDDAPVPVQIKQPAWTSNLTIINGTGNLLSFLTITGVLLYFLLASGDQVLRNIMSSLPDFASRRRFFKMLDDVEHGVSGYLGSVSIINLMLGVAVAIAMWLLGMPSPILWGAMAAAFNFIPIIGAIFGGSVIFLVAIVNFDSTGYAALVTIAFLTLTTIEGQFVTPAILGRTLDVSPVMVVLSLVFWGWMWGLMGVFLSVPILIAIKLAGEHYEKMESISTVLGGSGIEKAPDTDEEESLEEAAAT